MFFFADTVLQGSEDISAKDVLEAIEMASGKPSHLRVEIWHEGRRIAEIGRSPVH